MSQAPGAPECPFPSRTSSKLDALRPTPSSSFGSATLPFVTQPPALLPRAQDDSCSAVPNEVLLKISTQVLVPDYSSFYSATPIGHFSMSYTSFPDGSLVASPYIAEVRQGHWTLLFAGMMLMLFLTNTVISVNYIRRGRIKYKGLFYALFFSQVSGVIASMLVASSVIAADINCRIAAVAGGIFIELSSALLLSGILGVKAYRCLNDSKAVLAVIIVLQAASSTMVFVDLAGLDASRKLSLTCEISSSSILFSLSVTARFLIALFICLCFIYALWKSEKLPAAQGRISIYFSGHVPPEPARDEKEGSSTMRPRGWWDYVPETHANPPDVQQSRASTWHVVDDQGFVGNIRYLVGAWMKDDSSPEHAKRKASEATLVDSQRQHRSKPSVVHFQDNAETSRFSVSSRAQSSTPSKARSLGSLMNRMRLFREVMRNELAHTALITLINVIATVLGLVGAFAHLPIDPKVFIAAYWGILSLLVIHSFGRVVERHEREALLQHPAAWDPLYYVEKATNGELRQGLSSASVASNPWRARSTLDPLAGTDYNTGPRDVQEGSSTDNSSPAENPFEDFEFIGVSSGKGRNTDALWRDNDRAPEELSPSTRIESLLPDARAFPSGQRVNQDLFFTRRSQLLFRDSVSKYSDTSSRPRSPFYLEETR